MNISYNLVNIFPVPIHVFDVKEFGKVKNDLIDYAYNLKNTEEHSIRRSNYGGWQSNPFYLDDRTDKLHNFLINCLTSFPALDNKVQIYPTAWININVPGAFNLKHNHPTSDLSGVLWIKCSKNSGEIYFESPTCYQSFKEMDSYTQDFKNENKIDSSYFFPPVEGRILIFPSHLEHWVEANKSKEDRISVSFNIKLS
jgi:uncharacterized protein (TIGR02466 family)|tara:strand:- start:48 stop:641 length:594 start_codon:yes stop_codon:yes gene_type:complete